MNNDNECFVSISSALLDMWGVGERVNRQITDSFDIHNLRMS